MDSSTEEPKSFEGLHGITALTIPAIIVSILQVGSRKLFLRNLRIWDNSQILNVNFSFYVVAALVRALFLCGSNMQIKFYAQTLAVIANL